MQITGSILHGHTPVKEQIHELVEDLEGEVKRELKQHDSTQSDALLRRHIMGLILILFVLVGLILLMGMAAIGIGYHPRS